MIVSPDQLRKDTVALIKEIDVEIKRSGTVEHPASTRAALLSAKATAYNTLVLLQIKK